jgi:DNA-binding transcriptional ArsR family regulator
MLTVLHARDKTGKTLLAWEMARAVLLGTPFLGVFPAQAGRVVLALLDDPAELTVHRVNVCGLSNSADMRIVTPADADLSDPSRFLDEFRDACQSFEPALIIVDALVQFLPAGREAGNDASRMRPVMQKFNALAEELCAAVVLIAHDSKSGGDAAGSYVIRATAKTLLHLTRPRWDEEEEDDGRRMLIVTSKLSGEARHLLRLEGVGAWTYLGRGDSAREARTTWAKERVLHWLGGGGEGTVQEVAKAIKLRREDVLSALAALEEEGQVVSEQRSPVGGGRGRYKRVYFIPAGNKIPKERVGNKIPEALEPAQNAAQRDSIFVPPAWNLAGTKIDTPKPASNAGCSDGQEFCSQNFSSIAGTKIAGTSNLPQEGAEKRAEETEWL